MLRAKLINHTAVCTQGFTEHTVQNCSLVQNEMFKHTVYCMHAATASMGMELKLSSAAPVPGSPGTTPVACRQKMLRLLAVAAVAVALSSQLVPFLIGSPDLPLLALSRWWPFSVPPQTARRAPPAAGKATACVMFNFGDSNSDTGNLVAGAGFRLHRPLGRRFFGKPSGRFSDGRLYIDFICTYVVQYCI